MAKLEIESLCGQLVCTLALLGHAFAYGHAANIATIRACLLNDLSIDLRALDKRLFNPEIAVCRHVDNFGCLEMLHAFVSMP